MSCNETKIKEKQIQGIQQLISGSAWRFRLAQNHDIGGKNPRGKSTKNENPSPTKSLTRLSISYHHIFMFGRGLYWFMTNWNCYCL